MLRFAKNYGKFLIKKFLEATKFLKKQWDKREILRVTHLSSNAIGCSIFSTLILKYDMLKDEAQILKILANY